MSLKTIVAPVINLDEDEAALTVAGELTAISDGHAVALVVSVQLASAFSETQHSLSQVLADIAAGPDSVASQARDRILQWVEKSSHKFEVRHMSVENALNEHEIMGHALLSDLVVMAQGRTHPRARSGLIEHVLFKAGRPILVTPPERRERDWKRALIGWNAKPSAMRAVCAALPLLQKAEEVIVATVDARPSVAGHGEAPGHDLGAYLARHGVTAHVRNLDSTGKTHAEVLLNQAAADSADMLVLGAYGHSRAREFLLGGVTRDLLQGTPLPLLMAH